ncbi:tail fiber assembly protein [Pseudomonas sp. LB3P58]
MTDIYVQFSDETQTVITSVFGCPQDPAYWPNQGVVQDNDQRYLDFLNPPVSPADILAANQAAQTALMTQASQAMTPVLMALQLDATDAVTVKAKAWRDYYQELQAVDLTVTAPEWPVAPD